MKGFELLDPWMLLLALIVPAALWIARRRPAPSLLFAPAAFVLGDPADPDAAEPLPRTWRVRLVALPRVLQALGVVLAVVALARPVTRDRLPYESRGIDMLLCLDTSSSMSADDMEVGRSRLQVAKDAGARFVAGRPQDRIGLVTFARFPDVRCPPTLDHDALTRILADVGTVEIDGPEDATGIGTAVARSAQALRGGEGTSKVVVLLTDGAENVATAKTPEEIAPLHAGQLCREIGVRVYTIAVGVAQVGADSERRARPAARLAAQTGGKFYEARDAAAMADVYGSIDELERVAHAEPTYRIEERFLPFLAVALLLLVAGHVLRSTVLDVLP